LPNEVIMYTHAMCGDCQALKAYMDKKGIPHETRDIKENPAHGKELEEKTGKLGVPYLVVDGEWKRGYVPGQPFSEEFAKELLGA